MFSTERLFNCINLAVEFPTFLFTLRKWFSGFPQYTEQENMKQANHKSLRKANKRMVTQKFDFGFVVYFSQTVADISHRHVLFPKSWLKTFVQKGWSFICPSPFQTSIDYIQVRYLQNQRELNQNKDKHILLNDIHGTIRKTQAKSSWDFTCNHRTPLHNSGYPMQGHCFCNQVAQATEEWSKFQPKVTKTCYFSLLFLKEIQGSLFWRL